MNDIITTLMNFIQEREKRYFQAIIVLLIIFLFLAAQQFQDLVLFVSFGLLFGALYTRRQGSRKIEIGGFVGACVGFIIYGVYFIISTLFSLLL
jgi:hypothetical protein